ncbi:PspC domain-containing protein [Corynebacterium callunae]|uniref:PspC domain-containing protein n=1 Tax=Corynebacterium callunae TaxID=1721 RepID=UPI001FFECF42|nr:PspC domain-containing protein [Corynebacterium callunae]MCK2201023.1 PspC domain-containing protein [Corynebacterium callunae]
MSTFEENTQPHYVPFAQPGAISSYPSPSSSSATGTLQRMWQTRPVRLPAKQGGNAKVAGVCEGIGVRYQIDPVLIRLFFVVSGVFGAGIAAYLLAWLIMPRYSVPVSPLEAIWKPGHPQDRTHGWWLLIAFVMFSGMLSSAANTFGSASFLTYVLVAAMWWGLHKKQPIPPRGLLATDSATQEDTMNNPADSYPQPQPDLGSITPVEGYYAPFAQYSADAPSWDPLTQQHNSWDLHMQQPAPAKKRRRLWPWILSGGVGTGLVAVAAIGFIMFAIDPAQFEDEDSGIGNVSLAPSNASLQDNYSSGVGQMDLDLSNLAPLEEERDIQINSGVGEVKVILPENVPISLNCNAGVGTTHCDIGDLAAHNEGLSGEMLNISVSSGIGDVAVEFAEN